MGVRDISSREAIEQALDEYDRVGQDAFLDKYGFGRAYKYILVRNGNRYDAKAILGAAHGYQFPEQGPLSSSDFASSEAAVKIPLEALGFEIEIINRDPARYWIFQGNPKVWDVRRATYDFAQTSWSILQHKDEIKGGDRAFMWESGPTGGIVGLAEILEDPVERPDHADEYQVAEGHPLQGTHPRADIRILKAVDPPISRDEVKQIPELKGLSILKFAQGTNFDVTREEARVLQQLVDERAVTSSRDPLGPPKWTNAWWVNQQEFATERERGMLTAATRQNNGSPAPAHWRNLTLMKPNDLVLHYHDQHVVAVSRVRDRAVVQEADEIAGLADGDRRPRWLVEAEYFLLDQAVQIGEIPVEWRTGHGPFDVNGNVKQQYLNKVSEGFVDRMVDEFGERFRRGVWFKSQGFRAPLGGEESLEYTVDLLRRRKNVVFYGPPGTGKTRSAFQIRDRWLAKNGEGTVFNTTFHPSYGYEDFVQGFRPDKNDPGKFYLQPGVLLDACEAAKQRDVLLIIDEVNRGDVARIFGELITYIEADKRGETNKFALAQEPSNERFIPERLHVLGTMNTADKSVSLLDVALRRRFAFIEFRSDPFVLGSEGFLSQVGGVDLGKLLTSLNDRLLREGIETDRSIGHALLLISSGSADPVTELRERIRFDIVPLVTEYSYLDRARVARVLGGLVDDQGHFQTGLAEQDLLIRLREIASVTPEPAAEATPLSPEAAIEGEDFATEQDEV